MERKWSSKMIVRESRETFWLRHWRQFVDETQGMVPEISASKHTTKNYWKGENLKEYWLLTWQLLLLYSQDPYHVWKGSGKPPFTTTHLVHRSHFILFHRRKNFQWPSDPCCHTRKKGTQAHILHSWGLFSTGRSSPSCCCQILQAFLMRIKREVNPLMRNCQNYLILKTDILKVNVSATLAHTMNRGSWLRTGQRYHCLV